MATQVDIAKKGNVNASIFINVRILSFILKSSNDEFVPYNFLKVNNEDSFLKISSEFSFVL